MSDDKNTLPLQSDAAEEKKDLEMQFDPNTIEQLGIQLYSTLPPVISEQVSNAYDADAKHVTIHVVDEGDKTIVIKDDGHGMTFKDLNEKFLKIGRNRREEVGQKSESQKRLVIGKKGIGKLSFFGIAHKITVETVRGGLKNAFILDWNKLKQAGKLKQNYKPEIINRDVSTDETPGTKFTLTDIQRSSGFVPDDIAYSLARDMSVFNEADFKVEIFHNESEKPVPVVNELRYKWLEVEHSWDLPKTVSGLKYDYADRVKGRLIATKTVVNSRMNGIALFSRGKLVNEYSFLDVNASSNDYKYITGWLNIDFIDLWSKEAISTNRRSLNWEFEETILLKNYLEALYRAFFNDVKATKKEKKVKEIHQVTGIAIEQWINELPPHERKLANKLVELIIGHGGIETEKAGELVAFVKDSFTFASFRELAEQLDEESITPDKLIQFFKEWNLIEAREFYKLAIVRLKTIKTFEELIKQDAPEVPIMHDFLARFSWLLDPRLLNFRDEVTYSNLLRENFKEDLAADESDRRIDFLCHKFGNSFFIIELKRPGKVISDKELDQALAYVSFIQTRLSNEFDAEIFCYIVGKRLANTDTVKKKAEAYKSSGMVYVKPYEELLAAATNYHQEFITKYEQMIKGNSDKPI